MAKLVSGIPWWKYVGNIVLVLVIVAQIVSVESSSSGDNDTGSAIDPVEPSNLTDFINQTDNLFKQTATEEVSKEEFLLVRKKFHSSLKKLASKVLGGEYPSNSTLCTSEICKFNNQAEQLSELVQKLIELKDSNNSRQEELERQYKIKYFEFHRDFDNMKQMYEANLTRERNEMMEKITAKELKIKVYETQITNATIAFINANEFTKAYDESKRSQYNNTLFQTVIEQVYTFEKAEKVLHSIITRAYDNKVENIVKTVEFIHGLTNIMYVYYSYNTLFNAMTKNGHLHNEGIIEFAFRLKQTIQNVNFCSAVKNYRNLKKDFYNLRDNFPSLMTNLIYDGECTIKNFQYPGYLYISNLTRAAWYTTGNKGEYQDDKFRFFRHGHDTFHIRTDHLLDPSRGKYLTLAYADLIMGPSFNDEIAFIDKFAVARWKLIPQTVNNQKVFVFKNEWGMQYSPSKGLIAIGSYLNSERYRVSYDDSDLNNVYWELDCPYGIGLYDMCHI